jgi:hypothetical protein
MGTMGSLASSNVVRKLTQNNNIVRVHLRGVVCTSGQGLGGYSINLQVGRSRGAEWKVVAACQLGLLSTMSAECSGRLPACVVVGIEPLHVVLNPCTGGFSTGHSQLPATSHWFKVDVSVKARVLIHVQASLNKLTQ